MKKNKIIFQPLQKEIELFGMTPRPSKTIIPKWFKDIPLTQNGNDFEIRGGSRSNFTIKGCTPIMDAFTSGYTLVLDSDIQVRQGVYGPEYYWPNQSVMMEVFNNDSTNGFYIPENFEKNMAKFMGKWLTTTPSGYSILITHPLNRFDLPFQIVSAVVDTDKFPAFDLAVMFKKGYTGIIEAGTPIAQILPFKREEWQSEIKKWDEHTEEPYKKLRQKARDAYRRWYWSKKKYD